MSTREIFSIRLKQLREAKGLGTRELAREIGCNHSLISLYESQKREPTVSVLRKISDYFNVSADYLIGRTVSKY
jgi:transcriptional regulator with XRE-family HTH domain